MGQNTLSMTQAEHLGSERSLGTEIGPTSGKRSCLTSCSSVGSGGGLEHLGVDGVKATFLGGFLVEEEALEALVMFEGDLRTEFYKFSSKEEDDGVDDWIWVERVAGCGVAVIWESVVVDRIGTDFSEESVEKSWGKESANESILKFIPCFDSSFVEFVQPCFCFSDFEEFVNVFMRIGFGSTIKLVSFDESQVVTFNRKFIFCFWNGDCGTRSRSDNTVGNLHGFVIHGIEIFKGNEKVSEVIDVEN
ncbi:hypothetical protein Tco_0596923 [Tanacetum coccineum]